MLRVNVKRTFNRKGSVRVTIVENRQVGVNKYANCAVFAVVEKTNAIGIAKNRKTANLQPLHGGNLSTDALTLLSSGSGTSMPFKGGRPPFLALAWLF